MAARWETGVDGDQKVPWTHASPKPKGNCRVARAALLCGYKIKAQSCMAFRKCHSCSEKRQATGQQQQQQLEHKSKDKKASSPHQYPSALEISDRAVPGQEPQVGLGMPVLWARVSTVTGTTFGFSYVFSCLKWLPTDKKINII